MSKPRVLFSVPTRHHVEIAVDELDGLQELGYPCGQFSYAAKEGVTSATGRLKVIVDNALQLVKTAKAFKPDVIYLNSRLEKLAGLRDFITLRLFRLLYRKPVHFIIKSHGSDVSVITEGGFVLSKIVLPYLKKQVSGWIFLSSEEKRLVTQSGFLPANRVFVGKNVVRSHHFKPSAAFRQQYNLSPETQILLFVGRLIPEKGIYQVIEGYAQLLKKENTILFIVGWGSDEVLLKQRCDELGISNQVIFTGFLPEQQVVDFYANSDILVFPTYFPEGFPMALFNSVAAGLGIITTANRAATDYLQQPDNCLWVEDRNSASVTQAMQTLLTDSSLLATMRRNNLNKGSEFNRQQVATEIAQTIQQITQNNGHR